VNNKLSLIKDRHAAGIIDKKINIEVDERQRRSLVDGRKVYVAIEIPKSPIRVVKAKDAVPPVDPIVFSA
jgi:hypothetical protein